MNYAPIALFVYNRPEHTKNILDSLAKNKLSKESSLYIYCDGIKEKASKADVEKIKKVHEIVSKENRFENVIINKKDKNIGLSKSIVAGVTEIINKHKQIIVLEDDLIVSRHFLHFMNIALQAYKENKKVGTIAGCNFFANGKKFPNSFFLPITSSWGWATWDDRWKEYTNDNETLFKKIKESDKLFEIFTAYGSYPYECLMHKQINGKVDSWAISWHAVHTLNSWITCYPNHSMVNHIESENATHAKINIKPPLSKKEITPLSNNTNIDEKALEAMILGFSKKGNYFGVPKSKYQIINKIKGYFYKI